MTTTMNDTDNLIRSIDELTAMPTGAAVLHQVTSTSTCNRWVKNDRGSWELEDGAVVSTGDFAGAIRAGFLRREVPVGATAPTVEDGAVLAFGQRDVDGYFLGVVAVNGDTATCWRVERDAHPRTWAGFVDVPISELAGGLRSNSEGRAWSDHDWIAPAHELAVTLHTSTRLITEAQVAQDQARRELASFRDAVESELSQRRSEGSMTVEEIDNFFRAHDFPLPMETVTVEVEVSGDVTSVIPNTVLTDLMPGLSLGDVQATTSFSTTQRFEFEVEQGSCACHMVSRSMVQQGLPEGATIDDWETDCRHC